jgi:hypothetical protein
MRTTVTLDQDVVGMLRDAMHRTRRSFKETLNASLRMALGGRPSPAPAKPFVVRARRMGLRAGLDPGALNKLADELEVDGALEKSPGRTSA